MHRPPMSNEQDFDVYAAISAGKHRYNVENITDTGRAVIGLDHFKSIRAFWSIK